MTKVEIGPATDSDLARMFGGVVVNGDWYGVAAKRGNLVVAMGGALKHSDGKWYGFMDVPPYMRTKLAYRYAVNFIRFLKSKNVPVLRVTCDPKIPRSEAFLERLGFIDTGETLDSEAVWECQVSK